MATIYWPFPTNTVSEWPGTRPAGWAHHVGTDFAVPQGTPLRATMSGTIDIHWNDGLGAWVIDIIAPDGTVVRNGHMSYMAPKDGAQVNAGDYIGNTGGAPGTPGAGLSTGSHLHWELRNNRGWGANGWYDPRNLTILDFSSLDKPTHVPSHKPAPLHGMDNAMIVYYAHAQGKGKQGWLILGYTPKPLLLSTQKAANQWAERLGTAIPTDNGGFRKYLEAAGGSAAQISRVA